MRLDQLLGGVDVLETRGDLSVDIQTVSHDSRAVDPGALFCCLPGSRADGHDFAGAAARRGARALLVEKWVDVDLPQLRVTDARRAMGMIAAAVHDRPAESLTVVGVTGTNGKTTTTYLLRAVFEAHGWPSALIGTMSGRRTTPEASDLQAELARLRDGGTAAVAMEVSSPALIQRRVEGMTFAAAVFTNLGRDHLEVHRTMEEYFEAKAQLFTPERTRRAIVNRDDPYGRRLADRHAVPTVTYSMADAADLELSTAGSRFRWRGESIDLALPGRFNVANALAAATTAAELDVTPTAIAAGLGSITSVPGHFEWLDAGQQFAVAVDYAHTPEALEEVLVAARELTAGRVIVVFGCGGDRDPGKRPLMGERATALADLAVLTSDNPRSEDPLAIIDEVRQGVTTPERLVVEPDRARAIELALDNARPGDMVIIAGKGHEPGQEIGDQVVPFQDREVALEVLSGQ